MATLRTPSRIGHWINPYFSGAGSSLRVTPAMEAGIADHVWSLEEIAALVPEPVAKLRPLKVTRCLK